MSPSSFSSSNPFPNGFKVENSHFDFNAVCRLICDDRSEFVSDVSCDPWLECDELGPIPWQHPAGALYDLLEPNRCRRTWRLRVHYSAFPTSVVMRFNSGSNSALAHFLNSLKQVYVKALRRLSSATDFAGRLPHVRYRGSCHETVNRAYPTVIRFLVIRWLTESSSQMRPSHTTLRSFVDVPGAG